MADPVAIGYQDETTAQAAVDEVYRLSEELIIQPDAVAATVGDVGRAVRHAVLRAVPRDGGRGGPRVEAPSTYGGTVLKSSLSKDAEQELQAALHGQQATV